jgi:hypothetical protein
MPVGEQGVGNGNSASAQCDIGGEVLGLANPTRENE